MIDVFANPLFGIAITLLTFQAGSVLYKKLNYSFLNPLVVSTFLIIAFLLIFHVSFDEYNAGGSVISFFLGPATVILAVPLYRKISLLKENAIAIVTGITLGSAAGITSIILMCKAFGLDEMISTSLVPKSVTTPIGIELSTQLGGLPAITIAGIVVTGIVGAVMGPAICKFFRIEDKVAVGIAIGTSSHALGTTKAVEIGETEGAMSSLAIGIAGLVTVILAPLLVKLLM
ncbi:LrgB family protein [Methanolobus sp. ZRKC3]|uniref:LrgB family protein n=1 Tax=Methanolobus sp. ZRKC3 TaxID=3125786 RepID=UPI0032445B67